MGLKIFCSFPLNEKFSGFSGQVPNYGIMYLLHYIIQVYPKNIYTVSVIYLSALCIYLLHSLSPLCTVFIYVQCHWTSIYLHLWQHWWQFLAWLPYKKNKESWWGVEYQQPQCCHSTSNNSNIIFILNFLSIDYTASNGIKRCETTFLYLGSILTILLTTLNNFLYRC